MENFDLAIKDYIKEIIVDDILPIRYELIPINVSVLKVGDEEKKYVKSITRNGNVRKDYVSTERYIIETPMGLFASLRIAAKEHDLSAQTIVNRITKQVEGYHYVNKKRWEDEGIRCYRGDEGQS